MQQLCLQLANMNEVRLVLEAGRELIVGRADDCDLILLDQLVSLHHTAISTNGDGVWIKDLGSLNGTFLNGKELTARARLQDQDELHLGTTRLIFRAPQPRGPGQRRTLRLPPPGDATGSVRPTSDATQAFDVAELDQLLRTTPSSFGRDRETTARRLRCLYRMGYDLIAISDLKTLLERLVEIVDQALGAERVIFIDKNAKVRAATIKDRPHTQGSLYRDDVVGQAWQLGQAVQSRDLPEAGPNQPQRQAASAIAWPVSGPKGDKFGVLYVANGIGRESFSPEDARFGGAVAGMAGAVLANLAMLKKLERARSQILGWNRLLEAKVDERTTELKRKHQEVVQLSRFKDELLSMAAHDLRNPLTGILLTLDLAQFAIEGGATSEGLADLERVRNEVDRMTELLADLLDHQRIEAGRVEVRPQRLEAEEVLERLVRPILPVAQERQRRLALAVRATVIYADPLRLKQIVENLLSNALRYTRPGDSIWVEAQDSESGTTLTVRDSGPGISPEDRERIFSAFVRGDEAPGGEGTGLGLTIVRKLVELHGGRIEVEANPGGGALFRAFFPNQETSESRQAIDVEPIEDELRREIQDRLEEEVRGKLERIEGEIRQRLKEEARPEVEAQLRSALEADVRRELAQTLRQELVAELKETLRPATEDALRAELRATVETQLREELRLSTPLPAPASTAAAGPGEGPQLRDLPGVGASKAAVLRANGFATVAEVAAAPLSGLTRCKGIGQSTARKLQKHARQLLSN